MSVCFYLVLAIALATLHSGRGRGASADRSTPPPDNTCKRRVELKTHLCDQVKRVEEQSLALTAVSTTLNTLHTDVRSLDKRMETQENTTDKLMSDLEELSLKMDKILNRLGLSAKKCPSGWTEKQTSCYGYGSEKVSWADAQIICKLFGGYLAEVESQAENDFILDMIQSRGSNSSVWLGGLDVFHDGQWVWASDKRSVTFGAWKPGQETKGGKQDCLIMYSPDSYLWHDHHCRDVQHFICEIKLA